VFAPMYRQVTLLGILGGSIPPEAAQIAYGDVLDAWNTYLQRYNHGRGVVLIGHSQGTFVLRRLIRQEIDPNKQVRRQLISAMLRGGNVAVPEGGNLGGDFQNIPGCRSANQTGCVIAFSTFDGPVPANSLFGRAAAGDVLCTNPAALGGGSATLTSVFPSEPFAPGTIIGGATLAVGVPILTGVTTPWIESRSYTGACDSNGDADVLQISPIDGAPVLHPVPDQTWGLHLVDANIALGNLTKDIALQAAAWSKRNAQPPKNDD